MKTFLHILRLTSLYFLRIATPFIGIGVGFIMVMHGFDNPAPQRYYWLVGGVAVGLFIISISPAISQQLYMETHGHWK